MTTERVKENLHHWIDHHSNRADKAEELIDKLREVLHKIERGTRIKAGHFWVPVDYSGIRKEARKALALADKWRGK